MYWGEIYITKGNLEISCGKYMRKKKKRQENRQIKKGEKLSSRGSKQFYKKEKKTIAISMAQGNCVDGVTVLIRDPNQITTETHWEDGTGSMCIRERAQSSCSLVRTQCLTLKYQGAGGP